MPWSQTHAPYIHPVHHIWIHTPIYTYTTIYTNIQKYTYTNLFTPKYIHLYYDERVERAHIYEVRPPDIRWLRYCNRSSQDVVHPAHASAPGVYVNFTSFVPIMNAIADMSSLIRGSNNYGHLLARQGGGGFEWCTVQSPVVATNKHHAWAASRQVYAQAK